MQRHCSSDDNGDIDDGLSMSMPATQKYCVHRWDDLFDLAGIKSAICEMKAVMHLEWNCFIVCEKRKEYSFIHHQK